MQRSMVQTHMLHKKASQAVSYKDDRVLVYLISMTLSSCVSINHSSSISRSSRIARLGHAILVARSAKTPDHFRIVSVCPCSCQRKVHSEVVLQPEDPRWEFCSCGCIVRDRISCACRGGSEQGSNMWQPTRGIGRMRSVFCS